MAGKPENFRTAGLGEPFAQVSGGQRGTRPRSPRRRPGAQARCDRAARFLVAPNPVATESDPPAPLRRGEGMRTISLAGQALTPILSLARTALLGG